MGKGIALGNIVSVGWAIIAFVIPPNAQLTVSLCLTRRDLRDACSVRRRA